MITIIYEPKKNKVTIDGQEYRCHSVHRITQILQDMNYSTDTKFWKEGEVNENDSIERGARG